MLVASGGDRDGNRRLCWECFPSTAVSMDGPFLDCPRRPGDASHH